MSQGFLMKRGGNGKIGLKWTVSQTEPQKPKAGDLWIVSNPGSVKITQVVQIQKESKDFFPKEKNTIYVMVPEKDYPLPSDLITVTYFKNEKYELTLKCPYVFITNEQGEEIDIVRGIYTGTEWHMWGIIPEVPTEWTFFEAIDTTRTWTAPRTDEWYRVWVIGKSGDGGEGDGGYNGTAPGGGSSGGIACSILLGDDLRNIQCTVNGSLTSFGNHLSATSGGNGGNYHPSDIVGQGSGGTEYNLMGFPGGKGGTGGGDNGIGKPGENNGMSGGLPGGKSPRESNVKAAETRAVKGSSGGGGGGARLPSPYPGFPYIPDSLSNFYAGGGAAVNGGNVKNGVNADKYPSLDLLHPVVYGGGGGHGANCNPGIGNPPFAQGGKNSSGSPGLIIIEKGVN